jgi:hypothetical protein
MTVHCCFLACVGALVLAGDARADVGLPFFPRDKTNVQVHFQNLHDFPGFDFYLKCSKGIHIGRSGSHQLHQITSRDWTKLFSWGDLGTVLLVAVPRGQKLPTPDELPNEPDWLTKELPGTLQSKRLSGSAGVLSKNDNDGEIVYRVAIDGQNLSVEIVEARLPSRIGTWICLGSIVAVALGIVGVVGCWVFSRSAGRLRRG